MKTSKKIFAICLTLMLTLLLSSCSLISKESQYKENADGMALYRYKSMSTETEFTVPDEWEGKPVTELMDFSLSNADYLTKIKIGKNVTKIDICAMTNIPKLTAIEVDGENPAYTSVDGVLYNKDMTVLCCYPNAKSEIQRTEKGEYSSGGAFVVPDTVREIRDYAFYTCSNLYSIQFPEGLEKVGNYAFLKCTALSAIQLPSALKEIGSDGFSYCDSVKTLEIPQSVEKIGDHAFYSTASSIDKVVVHNAQDALTLGEDWLPKGSSEGGFREVPVEFTGK